MVSLLESKKYKAFLPASEKLVVYLGRKKLHIYETRANNFRDNDDVQCKLKALLRKINQ